MKFSKQLWKIIFKLEEVSENLNAPSAKPTQVKWHYLALVQPYGAKPLTCLSKRKILTCLNII